MEKLWETIEYNPEGGDQMVFGWSHGKMKTSNLQQLKRYTELECMNFQQNINSNIDSSRIFLRNIEYLFSNVNSCFSRRSEQEIEYLQTEEYQFECDNEILLFKDNYIIKFDLDDLVHTYPNFQLKINFSFEIYSPGYFKYFDVLTQNKTINVPTGTN